MYFKENLLKKIRIDRMAEKILNSIGPPDSGRKVDKETMRKMLEMSAYQTRKERDLELYMQDNASDIKKILVLDNELPVYNTTVADVVLRKSPTLKEMLSIRNALKILNDADVLVCKKEDSIRFIQNECISLLDLTFHVSDLQEIQKDGVASFERGYTDGVEETLDLFSELLGYTPLPKEFMISNHIIIGPSIQESGRETLFGPFIIYGIIHNTIMLFDDKIGIKEKEKIERLHMTASGREKASKEGSAIFQYLSDCVLLKNPELT
ncbi:MAG: hypothetical protein EHM85_05370 [Desulfobacteraceae bacterium]|nr:MAG: hypothetical protein EHM85_05370 [Desulfobacteraceae bacterium]